MSRQPWTGNNPLNLPDWGATVALANGLNSADLDPSVEVVVSSPAIYLISLQSILRKDIKIAAQNCYSQPNGPFAGETSPAQLKGSNIPYVILGSSQRVFGESSELIAQKTRAALDNSLSVALCVGETLAEREAGKTAEALQAQLKPVVDLLTEADWAAIVIGYEPIWAIGNWGSCDPRTS